MRKVALGVLAFVSLGFIASAPSSADTNLTQQQVANVCGKDLKSGGGHTGCTHSCGQGGKEQCNYDCVDSTGKCTGGVIKNITTAPGGSAHKPAAPTAPSRY